MAVNTVENRRNLGSANTDRNPSPNIWYDCPWNELVEGVASGVYFWEDFESFPKTPPTTEGNWGRFAVFSSTGGAMTAGTGLGGELVIGSDDDAEGVGLRTLSTPFKIIRGGGKLWFEIRVKLSTIADTTFEFFAGLIQDIAFTAAIPITNTAATLADYNMVGFYRTESDGDAINTTYKADGVTAVTVQTGAVVPVASTYMKLGLVFDTQYDVAGLHILSFYNNNLRLSTTKTIPSAAGTDFPNDIALGLCFAVRNAVGSSPGTATIDWMRCAMLI